MITAAAALVICVCVPGAAHVQERGPAGVLPAPAVGALARSLELAAAHPTHVWRDTRPVDDGGLVSAYVEIPRGERRKWEFDMAANRRAVDRVMPEDVGGYPVNYGFVPQTISYDGDPFDALVLGPPLPGGKLVRGAVVGVFLMRDEKGHDAKVVLSPVGGDGSPAYAIDDQVRRDIEAFFRIYKRHEPDASSTVEGWGSAETGLDYVLTTHAFFRECRAAAGAACRPGG